MFLPAQGDLPWRGRETGFLGYELTLRTVSFFTKYGFSMTTTYGSPGIVVESFNMIPRFTYGFCSFHLLPGRV